MKTNIPKSIKRPKSNLLEVEFSDGLKYIIKIEKLRQECPCAECKGEEIMGNVVSLPAMPMFKPGMNDLKQLEAVGNYAVNAVWGDGHNSGIYNWDYLREICEKHALTDEEITKLDQKTNNK